MKKWNIYIKNFLWFFLSSFKSAYREIKSLKKISFRLEEIDLKTKTVTLRCHGTCAILKMSFVDAIKDITIISSLPAHEACWLGYYYAKSSKEFAHLKGGVRGAIAKTNFLLSFVKGRYKIISQDRAGKVTYVDLKSKKITSDSPRDLCKAEHLISQFDPTQACYIGILAGSIKVCSGDSLKIKLRLVE